MSKGTTFTLNNGVEIPAVGFGTFANEGAQGETYKAVSHALKTGYRHLDCAWFYQNEGEVGDALQDFLKENSNVKRSDIFICTKVWNHLHEPDEVRWSIQSSLEKLKTDYVDLFLVHWPIAAEKDEKNMPKLNEKGHYVIKKELTENHEPTWRAMEELHAAGKAKAIGVSNWTIPQLKKMLSFAKVKPAVNQIEVSIQGGPSKTNSNADLLCFRFTLSYQTKNWCNTASHKTFCQPHTRHWDRKTKFLRLVKRSTPTRRSMALLRRAAILWLKS